MKECSRCLHKKDLSSFFKNSSKKDGYHCYCKDCYNIHQDKYYKSKKGLIARIYGNQKSNSKQRGHTLPSYTLKEFRAWIMSKDIFHKLYSNWEENNFEKLLCPSVDRINDFEKYSFSNIRIVTWKDNKEKQNQDILKGRSTSGKACCKKVKQYDLNGNFIKSFVSLAEAQRSTGALRSNIKKVCEGKRKKQVGIIGN